MIIPVYNETLTIASTIEHLLGMGEGSPPEIIVVDGNPAGNTIGAVKDPRVKKLLGKKGRGAQMNRGAAEAGGDILLFLHADTRLPENGFTLIHQALSDPGVDGGAFDLSIDGDKSAYRLIEKAASARSRLTRLPYGDQAHFMRKTSFHRVGGYPEIPLMEDVEFMRRLKRERMRIILIGRPVRTAPRRWETEGILRCTLRNWLLISMYLCGVSPEKLAAYYHRD